MAQDKNKTNLEQKETKFNFSKKIKNFD